MSKILKIGKVVGKDATINGLNTLTITGSDGITITQENDEINISASVTPQQIGAETPQGTQSKIDAAISNLVNSAPEELNTLKELADALNNDANLASTLTTEISKKVDTEVFNDSLNQINDDMKYIRIYDPENDNYKKGRFVLQNGSPSIVIDE